MNRNYNTPAVAAHWADSRQTDLVVATAIHAIADRKRTPEAIWEAPTAAEWDRVLMAVEEYVTHCDFPRQESYSWGQDSFS